MKTPLPKVQPSSSWEPLTAEKQWQNLLAHHVGQWRGRLVRYDGAGQVIDILDSIRQFLPSRDRQTITHALDFKSRLTGTVTQKQWRLTAGTPLIHHPVDPTAYLVFNQTATDAMMGRDRRGKSFYFEPYLRIGQKRASVVVMYRGEASVRPSAFSLFREVCSEESSTWWSDSTDCILQPVQQLSLNAANAVTQVQLADLTYRVTPLETTAITEDFLQIQFPDEIELIVSHDRLQTPYYASLRWHATPEQITRHCSLFYFRSDQPAEILAL